MTPARTCSGCTRRPVAHARAEHCHQCMPGGPFIPPPCRSCRSSEDYYSAGLCRRCHRFAASPIDSCRDCHCWGVTRTSSWLCDGCRAWRRRRPTGRCPCCARDLPLSPAGFCRSCWRQGWLQRLPHERLDVIAANRHGQQLYLADLFRQKRPTPPPRPESMTPATGGYPVEHRQLVLLDLPRNLANLPRHAPPGDLPDPDLGELLTHAARAHATAHGWSETRRGAALHGIRVLLATQDTPGAAINASAVAQLSQLSLAVQPVRDVLRAAGMLQEDRPAVVIGWFDTQVHGLPAPMHDEVRAWFEALLRGSPTLPRTRPLAEGTVRLRVGYAIPTLRGWAEAGHQSLREITRAHVHLALPAAGSSRALTGQALRSLFRFLKARRIVFLDPTAHIRTGQPETRQPLPVDITALRDAIHGDHPTRAALAALVAFHAIRNGQLRDLHLTDVRDGRLHLDGRTVLLAAQVRQRLGAWLDHRAERWPHTANAHLFINAYTAVRTVPVSRRWINQTLGLPSQAVREDRILHEALASGGDVRRLCDMFGLSVKAAERYTAVLDHQALATLSSRTEAQK